MTNSDTSVKPINNTEALYYKICQIKTFFTHFSLPTTILSILRGPQRPPPQPPHTDTLRGSQNPCEAPKLFSLFFIFVLTFLAYYCIIAYVS